MTFPGKKSYELNGVSIVYVFCIIIVIFHLWWISYGRFGFSGLGYNVYELITPHSVRMLLKILSFNRLLSLSPLRPFFLVFGIIHDSSAS